MPAHGSCVANLCRATNNVHRLLQGLSLRNITVPVNSGLHWQAPEMFHLDLKACAVLRLQLVRPSNAGQKGMRDTNTS
jgi:hypothetical protein